MKPSEPPKPMPPEEIKAMFAQMAKEAAELKTAVGGSLTDMVADWLVPQYVVAAREQLSAAPNEGERWKLLRLAANDLVALRRGDHSAVRLALEREKFAEVRRQQRAAEERQKPEAKKGDGLTPEALQRIEQAAALL